MSGFLITLQVIVTVILIGVILLQPGSKGGGLGAAFGGGGANSAFGARGAAPFLAKATYWVAGAFLVMSLLIEVNIVKDNRSVLDKKGVTQSAPATPAPAPAPQAPQAPAQNPAPAQK
nr:preprotein translocase subunit SecG [uncultured Holophaga sp.]